jgi:two-component system sensor histidine kinase KdpD
MFLTYFVVAITVGSLTSRLRAREQAEREREQRATALYQFAQKIAAAPSLEAACNAATDHIREVLGARASVLLSADGKQPRDGDFAISRFDATFGMLRVDPPAQQKLTAPDRELLGAFADELANLIERDRLMQIAAKAQLGYQAERLRKALLDCVSHELKTPIAAIKAASQQLLGAADSGAGELARQLAHEIENGSERLNRVVNNLLDMTRLESGVIKPKLEWCEVGELLQGAIESEQDVIGSRQVIVDVPDDLPLALMDHSLIEQAIAKVLANAATYSRAGLPIEISAECAGHELVISVADRGPGLSRDAIERVFEKFYRANGSSAGGLGLGLSIARGFVEAHGGTITAENRQGGGTRFKITVPVSLADAKALEAAS